MYDLDAMVERIKILKKQKGLSNDTLAATSGVPKGTLAKILGNGTKDPQISSIIKIAHALGVSADYLVYGETIPAVPPTISPDEQRLLDCYRQLSQQGKEYILQTLDMASRVYVKNIDFPNVANTAG